MRDMTIQCAHRRLFNMLSPPDVNRPDNPISGPHSCSEILRGERPQILTMPTFSQEKALEGKGRRRCLGFFFAQRLPNSHKSV